MDKMHYNFQKICRVCLNEADGLIDMFDSNNNLCQTIMTCSNIKVFEDDGLPSKMCLFCIKQANDALNFKQKCELSDLTLRNYLTSHSILPLPIIDIIKEELLEMREFDDLLFNQDDIPLALLKLDNSIKPKNKKCIKTPKAALTTESIRNETEIFACTVCERKFPCKYDLQKHLIVHRDLQINGETNTCPMCGEHFIKHAILVRHVGQHLRTSKYECKVCQCFFTTSVQLSRHTDRKHPADVFLSTPNLEKDDDLPNIKDEPSLSGLDLTFNDKFNNSLELDLETVDLLADISTTNIDNFNLSNDYSPDHTFDGIRTNDTKPDDDFNRLSFKSEFVLNESDVKMEFHADLEKDAKSDPKTFDIFGSHNIENVTEAIKTVNEKEAMTCKTCGKVFASAKGMRIHVKFMRCKGNEMTNSNLCPYCGIAFRQKCLFNKHIVTHNGAKLKPSYVCYLCKMVVSNSNYLQEHMKTHKLRIESETPKPCEAKKKVHLCSVCGKSCSSSSNLAVHLRRHAGTMTSCCRICGKGFPRTTDLTVHMRLHTGERPYSCSVCSRAFPRSDRLSVHMRTHTGEKPYVCQFCNRGFAQSNDLAAHKKRNTCGINLNTPSDSDLDVKPAVSENTTLKDQTVILLTNNKSSEILTMNNQEIQKSNALIGVVKRPVISIKKYGAVYSKSKRKNSSLISSNLQSSPYDTYLLYKPTKLNKKPKPV